ncbi:unnamed protein product [Hymenolepis diminuta]|uniref:Uncharacterized protein n=1 Tax=Hymenolepis diminuta TaxID=6216 RepID=A0A564Z2W7_HYMDI|nr:unnamed protein product [Hymenolepis diminuta]
MTPESATKCSLFNSFLFCRFNTCDYTTAKVENDESQWIENEATAKTASATNLRGSDY